MTRFLDVRLQSVGGELAVSVAVNQGTSLADYVSLNLNQLLSDIRGRHVLLGVHGFNVDRANGIASLSNWESLLQLVQPSVFIGMLWPGDSIWAHGLDYPEEPRIANQSGELFASFIDSYFAAAASISFASHSLGARVLLETVAQMTLPVRRAIIMAGAIDDDCLNTEFAGAAANIQEISLLASQRDEVLELAFPLGNLMAGILTVGHPWCHSALGRNGPCRPWPPNLQSPFEIPGNWNYGHGNYLEIAPAPLPVVAGPVNVPANGSELPGGGAAGWQSVWSAAFASTRFG